MQERRTERRFPLLRRATLLVGTSSAINCTVRDISAAGAGLTASGAADLSGEVKLTLDGGRTYRPARVAWGLLDRAGIKFDATLNRKAAPAHQHGLPRRLGGTMEE